MRRSRLSTEGVLTAWRSDRGSASLEFITVGLLLLVPTVYLVMALSALQAATFGIEGAARQASRVFVQSSTVADAEKAAARAIEVTLADYGLDVANATVTITCRPDPRDCLARQTLVTVTIGMTVALPFVPPALGIEAPSGVRIGAASTAQVSRFAGGTP